VAGLAAVVLGAAASGTKLRVVGAGHTSSALGMVDDGGWLVDLRPGLSRLLGVSVDAGLCTFTAEAGITLRKLCDDLHHLGLALPNLGTVLDITLGGALATAYHGTGLAHRCLAGGVVGLAVMGMDGVVRDVGPEGPGPGPDIFRANLCGLGMAGIIVSATLHAVPSFDLWRSVEAVSADAALFAGLGAYAASADHPTLTWSTAVRSGPPLVHVRRCSRQRDDNGRAQMRARARARGWAGLLCPCWRGDTAQSLSFSHRVPAGRGRSDRIFASAEVVPQRTTEWAVALDMGSRAMAELWRILQEPGPGPGPVFYAEVRFSAADDIWMSPARGRETCWLGVYTFIPPEPERGLTQWDEAVTAKFARVGAAMHRLGGRAHPAKEGYVCSFSARFLSVCASLDPQGLLRGPS